MTTEPTTGRAAWDEGYRRTRALLAGLSPADLDRPTANPGWTVRNLAAHIATADDFTAMCVKPLSRGKGLMPIPVPSAIVSWIGNRQNASAVKSLATAGAAELVTALDESHAKATALLDAVPAEGWDRPGKIPLVGTLTLAAFLEFSAGHWDEHSEVLSRARNRG